MAVELKEETKPGELYFGFESQEIFYLHHFCTKPTATLERVDSDEKIGGAIDSPLLDPFIKLSELNKLKLVNIIENLSDKLKHKKIKLEGKCNQIEILKKEIVKFKLK